MVFGGYTTSSNNVNKMILADGLDSFEILILKTDIPNVYEFETKFLNEHNCAISPFWLNYHNNDSGNAFHNELYKNNMIRLHGKENPMQVDYIKEKQVKNIIENYGVDNVSKHESIKAKKKNTTFKNYGTLVPFQSEEIKLKIRITNNANLGVDYPMQSKVVRDKRDLTVNERYGVSNVMQSPDVIELRKKNSLDKRGVGHHNSTESAKIRMSEISKIARSLDPTIECPHCHKLIKGKGNFNRWHGENCKLNV